MGLAIRMWQALQTPNVHRENNKTFDRLKMVFKETEQTDKSRQALSYYRHS